MNSVNKSNKLLLACSIVTLGVVFGQVSIEKVNLGVVTINNLATLTRFGLFAYLSYLLWEFYQNWITDLKVELADDLENYLCTFLTKLLIERIKEEGPKFCDVDQTFIEMRDWSCVSAKSSWFNYHPDCGRYSSQRCLRVQLENKVDPNQCSELKHVVHYFDKDDLNDIGIKYWLSWLINHTFFRIAILPAVLGLFAWLSVLVSLIVS